MKLKFTKKLILHSITNENGILNIKFASYLKEDYVERAVELTIKNNIAEKIFFSSNIYGTSTWIKRKGFFESHRWEKEDDVQAISYISKHYTALLENGRVPAKYVCEKIVPDVLEHMIDLNLSKDIYKILESPREEIVLNWNDIINKNKELSDRFVNELILKYEKEIKDPQKFN